MSLEAKRVFTEADAHLALAMAALEGKSDELAEGSSRIMRQAHEIHALLKKARSMIKRRR